MTHGQPEVGLGRRLLCLLGAHRWTTRTDAGARWQECRFCAKVKKSFVTTANRFPPSGFGDTAGGM